MIQEDGVAGQRFIERPPMAAMAGLASTAWIQEISAEAAPYTHWGIPDARIEIACQIGAVPRITGARIGPGLAILSPATTIVGLRFHAAAASSVLRVPPSELVGTTISADLLWGSSAVEAGERIASATSPDAALGVLQGWILDRLRDCPRPDPIVGEAVGRLLSGKARHIGSLAGSLSISERQLLRRCEASTGFAPKTLHRMLRFQVFQALAQRNRAAGRPLAGDGLAELAIEAGYADQAHMTRECLRLSGQTPAALLRRVAHHCAQGHDHAASYQPVLRARARSG